jgi:hypothetical protein
MAKSNSRKRANKSKKSTKQACECRSCKRQETPKTVDRENVVGLYQNETIVFNELVELSNQYAKLKKQYDQYEFIRVNLIARRKKIQKGEIELPIQIQLTQDMYYTEGDKKKILKLFDEQIKTITNSVAAVKQQVIVRRDMYIESGLRLLEFAQRRYGQYKPEEFSPRGVGLNKDEQKITEKEYDELFKADVKDMEKPEVKAAFEEAKKLAVAKNKGLVPTTKK